MGAYSRWALIRGWALIRINTVHTKWSQQNQKGNYEKTTSLIHWWINAWTCSRKEQMHNSWIFTVFSNMANRSFNFFVRLSINDWTENVESVNNSPFWEETQSFIFFCQITVNETVFFGRFLQMLSTVATIEVSVVYLQCSVSCHVNSLPRTVFENICFPFFLHKLTSDRARKSQAHKTVTIAASFSSVQVNKNVASSIWKSTTVNHFAIKSRCLNTIKSFLTFKIINSGIFLYLKKVLTLKLGKIPSSWQQFCFALYSPPRAVNITS